MNDDIQLANDLWEVTISPANNGRVIRLVDRRTGAVRVKPLEQAGVVGEGGHDPFFGLECWPKQGTRVDPRIDLIRPFSPLRGQPMVATILPDGVRLQARHDGMCLTLEWRLPAGPAPLLCHMETANEAASPDQHQIECFFVWHVPQAEWARTAAVVPGHSPIALRPYGELNFDVGDSADGCAAWWSRGTDDGVALRASEGIGRFFVGVHSGMFMLGPHSVRRALAPGESVVGEFEIAPLAWACGESWPCDTAAAEKQLADEEAAMIVTSSQTGGLSSWAKAGDGPAVPTRALHLTFQYEPVELREAVRLLENVAAPAGYNQIMVEVGQALRYTSHPKVAPDWAWSRAQWQEYVKAARSLGMDVVPQFNALGHQPESGLTKAYPELSEDPFGWCVCTRHPNTRRYLCEIFDELIDVFQPHTCNIGLDEIDMNPERRAHSGRDIFGCCPRCREADGGDLLAEHVLGLHEHLKGRGMGVIMWGDMLMYKKEHNCRSGLKAGTWPAIDQLPRDIILADWAYSPVPDYGASRYFIEKGFRVMGATWQDPRPLPSFSRFATENGLVGMIQTTWSPPTFGTVPLVFVLLAGKYFQNPFHADMNQALAEAKALALALAQNRT